MRRRLANAPLSAHAAPSLLPTLVLASMASACTQQGQQPGQDVQPLPGGKVTLADAFPAQPAFDRPLYMDHHASDPGHYWVVEQYGRISRIPADGTSKERDLVLDWNARVLHPKNGGHDEEGLLGFAFDPGYAENRQCWVYWSRRKGRDARESVISRLRIGEKGGRPQVEESSELEVMTIDQPFSNHNGGTILFGPDGMLYVGLGDGGAANDPHGNGQNLRTLLGSILRIDVRDASEAKPYAVPADNPFVGIKDARGEIWAYGLRNVWRMSFDRANGDLWCGDVGQNLWEEVDRVVKGGNYGWNLMEGNHPFPPKRTRPVLPKDYVPPVAEYSHARGLSVTGGYVYRGQRIPDLIGCFVYADYLSGLMWAVREDRDGGAHQVLDIGQAGPRRIASFAEAPDGELFTCCFDGRIYRVEREAAAPAPGAGAGGSAPREPVRDR